MASLKGGFPMHHHTWGDWVSGWRWDGADYSLDLPLVRQDCKGRAKDAISYLFLEIHRGRLFRYSGLIYDV